MTRTAKNGKVAQLNRTCMQSESQSTVSAAVGTVVQC